MNKSVAKAKVINHYGIHARPSAIIAKELQKFKGTMVEVEAGDNKVEFVGIMEIMSLGLECGVEATVTATGPQAEEAAKRIAELISHDFDFER